MSDSKAPSNAIPGHSLLFPFINPEFRRNLWLEMGWMRLIGAPVALGGLFSIILTQIGDDPGQSLEFASTIAFFLIVGVGGCRRAANSIPNEMKMGTWDNQRMSGMSAVSMAWSKLIGCTVFQWYAGLICLGFLLYGRDLQGWEPGWQVTHAITLLVVAICGQSMAMCSALAFIRKNRFDKRFRVSFSHLVGLVFMMVSFKIISPGAMGSGGLPGLASGVDYKQLLDWHGLPVNRSDFRHVSLVVALLFSAMGLIRMMQIELRYRVRPIAWPLFTLGIVAFCQGFSPTIVTIIYDPLIGMTLAALALTYIALFLQPKDPVQIAFLLKGKAPLSRRLQHIPMWVFPLLVTIVLGSLLAWKVTGTKTVFGMVPIPGAPNIGIPQVKAPVISAVTFALIAFIIRDILLVHLMAMRKGQWRSDWGGFFILVGLYSIFPTIAVTLGYGDVLKYLMPFLATEEPTHMIISALVQVVIMLGLVIWRWTAIQPKHTNAPPTISAGQSGDGGAPPPPSPTNSTDQMRHAAE
ncbi:MAG: hypothetical protein Alpg2KO_29550 [Alphaproteobacteria bacterium]